MTTRNVLVFGLISFFLYACKKTDNNSCVTNYGSPTAAEVTALRNYTISNGIFCDENSRGFFYHITYSGAGTSPTIADTVTVKYKGTLTNGTVFDSTAEAETRRYPLAQLITGWQLGLPLIKKGGIIDLYLPSSHGFGCTGQAPVPGNSITIFHIELVDF